MCVRRTATKGLIQRHGLVDLSDEVWHRLDGPTNGAQVLYSGEEDSRGRGVDEPDMSNIGRFMATLD